MTPRRKHLLRGRDNLSLRPRTYSVSSFKLLSQKILLAQRIDFEIEYRGLRIGFFSFNLIEDEAIIEYGLSNPDEWSGRGFMTQAVDLVCLWAFALGIKRLTAQVSINNIASQKILGRNGFNILEQIDTTLYIEKYAPKKRPAP